MDLFLSEIENKLRSTPDENLKEPPLNIVGPALEDMFKYCYNEEYLRKMYVELIAASVNSDKTVHPSYSQIIRQLSREDAILLSTFISENYSNIKHPTRLQFVTIEPQIWAYITGSTALSDPLFLLHDNVLHVANDFVLMSLESLSRIGLLDIKSKTQPIGSLKKYHIDINNKFLTARIYDISPSRIGANFILTCCDTLRSPITLINSKKEVMDSIKWSIKNIE